MQHHQRLCQLLGVFQTKDLSCLWKCKCSAWKAVPRSTGEAAEGKIGPGQLISTKQYSGILIVFV